MGSHTGIVRCWAALRYHHGVWTVSSRCALSSSSFAALKLLEMLEKYISSAAQMPAVSATVVELVVDLLRVRCWLPLLVACADADARHCVAAIQLPHGSTLVASPCSQVADVADHHCKTPRCVHNLARFVCVTAFDVALCE